MEEVDENKQEIYPEVNELFIEIVRTLLDNINWIKISSYNEVKVNVAIVNLISKIKEEIVVEIIEVRMIEEIDQIDTKEVVQNIKEIADQKEEVLNVINIVETAIQKEEAEETTNAQNENDINVGLVFLEEDHVF